MSRELTDEQVHRLTEMIRVSASLRECDNKKLLWLFHQSAKQWIDSLPITSVACDIISEIENRLVPEYDGETVYMTKTGWMTPEGPINYL